jgi:hypothetical protein
MINYNILSHQEFKKLWYHLRGLLFSGISHNHLIELGYPKHLVLQALYVNRAYLKQKREAVIEV